MPSNEINDDYDHSDNNLEYILENTLMPDDGTQEYKILHDEYNSQLLQQCECKGQQHSCCCSSNRSCSHGGSYILQPTSNLNELVIVPEIHAILECNDLCTCNPINCVNRLVQKGPRRHLEVFESPIYKSKGLRTKKCIPRGAFICEYAGELITCSEATRRLKINDDLCKMNYILCVNEYSATRRLQVTTIIDPSRRGNIGRYLNHSCQPNCDLFVVRINSPLPKICLFANRDIAENEELCFHYGKQESESAQSNTVTVRTKDQSKESKLCLCGASNCTGAMPNIQITQN